MKLIVCSQQNLASKNMHSLFLEDFGFSEIEDSYHDEPIYEKGDYKLVFMENPILDVEHLNDNFDPEVYIIASTHKSESGNKTLTAHSTGNWDEAKYGGEEGVLCESACQFQTGAFLTLLDEAPPGYDVRFEATHHGPSEMNAPLIFVEVGSTEEEWSDLDACRAACKSILTQPVDKPPVFCIGGGHYTPSFSSKDLLNRYCVGHICPKYYLEELDHEMIEQALEKTHPRAEKVLFDPGVDIEEKERIIEVLEQLGVPYETV